MTLNFQAISGGDGIFDKFTYMWLAFTINCCL